MPAHKKTLEEKQAYRIMSAIQLARAEQRANGVKVTQKDIADSLGIDRSRISKAINNPLKAEFGVLLRTLNMYGADITEALKFRE